MTEAEAKTKWCPFGRGMTFKDNPRETATGFNIGLNTDTREQIPITMCLGSECMAWRTYEEYRGDTNDTDTKVYCGLVGKP